MRVLGFLFASLLVVTACGDDDDDDTPPKPDAAVADAGDDSPDAAPPTPTAERGKYLVEAVASCGDCHTPRMGMTPLPDVSKTLSGVECLIDVDPENADFGCIN